MLLGTCRHDDNVVVSGCAPTHEARHWENRRFSTILACLVLGAMMLLWPLTSLACP